MRFCPFFFFWAKVMAKKTDIKNRANKFDEEQGGV
jgi:hypothetical protein